MKKRERSADDHFLVSPYLFALILTAMLLLGVATALFLWFVCGPNPVVAAGWERAAAIALFLGLDAVFLIAVLLNDYEMLGWVTIDRDAIRLHAPFHRIITLLYTDAAYVGMDYCTLSVNKQFWIVLSKEPILDCYRHRINRLKQSKDCIRIQYSSKVFEALSKVMPKPQYKQLQRCLTMLRTHKEMQ